MSDPLSQVIELLRPRAVFAKTIEGAGRWAVRYTEFGQPGFCAMLEGRCRLAVDGEAPRLLETGDFVLLPATPAFTLSSLDAPPPRVLDPRSAGDAPALRHGRRDGPPDVRQFGGYFAFAAPDAALLVSLLPRVIHVRGVPRLAELVRLLGDEAARDAVGRTPILERLVEILLIEALRAVPGAAAGPGLLRGLADPRIAVALRRIHADAGRAWTAAALAREAGMSRSAFFERFTRTVGVRPMEYLLAWRMAVAKDLLRGGGIRIDDVARRTGYGSPATFSTAFSRHVGAPPGRFRRAARAAAR
ncbi:MAG TPA: AraC family transcriptional regulator [Amaricoccus sp.]|uniref:AraC family transcriptional regulator n=1 Tax=Amaricoccus sp. TaxID=1872485 RepID=UPI002BE18C1E|nr:AraC family transcriptional regulator [Amaricoccus sp.]HMR51702.1 AraC family transcriptional regulator [Amaricoccus sp.]HMT98586.1 AraC family transcriptional regulator [Amaricoccus sp.]